MLEAMPPMSGSHSRLRYCVAMRMIRAPMGREHVSASNHFFFLLFACASPV